MQLYREVSVLGPASSSFNLFGKDPESKVPTVGSDPTIECQNGQISNAGTDADGGRKMNGIKRPERFDRKCTPRSLHDLLAYSNQDPIPYKLVQGIPMPACLVI